MKTSPSLLVQWAQLIALAFAHFVFDCFPGLMHTILPAIQESFVLNIQAGGVLLTVFLVASNGIQILIGHLRCEQDRPLFLYLGLLLTCAILFFGWVSPQSHPLLWLSLIAFVCGCGVGMTHPESLRAIHRLDGISSSLSSAIFMGGGVFGFAFGSFASTHLFQRYGFFALIPFCITSVAALVMMLLFRIRLAVERDEHDRQTRHSQQSLHLPVSFWTVMAIATLGACSVQVLMWIVPQHISHIGADLTRGGKAVSLFSLAGGVGGIVLARSAARRGEMKTVALMLATGVPFVLGYVLLLEYKISVLLLAVGGFFCFGAYPLMVSIARHCKGPNLGRRMGLIVGGIWLGACLLPMLLGPVAKHLGPGFVIFLCPVGFLLALALSVRTAIKCSRINGPKGCPHV